MNTTLEMFSNRSPDQPSRRRDFLYVCTATIGVTGATLSAWPFIDSMNPSADVMAVSRIEVDLTPISIGQRITVKWRGNPVFIVRRTPKQIAMAQSDDGNPDMIDPEPDLLRVKQPEWLIIVGVCTHLGCIPLGQRDNDMRGKWDGWFCPCHGSLYDISGRVRRGPAPKNLVLPPYEFTGKGSVMIG